MLSTSLLIALPTNIPSKDLAKFIANLFCNRFVYRNEEFLSVDRNTKIRLDQHKLD